MSPMAGLFDLTGKTALVTGATGGLGEAICLAMATQGARVNAISPGLVRTPLSAGLMADAGFMQRRLAQTPLRRVGEPHEVAGVAVMLASAAGAFVTRQNLVVDGGTLISDGA